LDSVTYDPYDTTHLVEPSGEAWDSVVALHVLEHSNDPESTVKHMKHFLKPGGRLVLAVPNFAARGYRELGMGWVWAQPPVIHIFHFTEEGLRALLSRCGFSDVLVSYTDRWDANHEADIRQMEHFRNLSRSWSWARHGSFFGAAIKRRLIALWTSRARFAALKHAKAKNAENPRELAELQIIATV
jgi:SAM-dependent methyltransferase